MKETSPPPTPSPKAVCHLGLCFSAQECTQWDLNPNHLLHSPTSLPDSQPSPFTKHQFLRTLSRCYLPFGMTAGDGSFFICVCVLYVCVCVCMSVHVRPSVCPSREEVIPSVNVCERVLRGEDASSCGLMSYNEV